MSSCWAAALGAACGSAGAHLLLGPASGAAHLLLPASLQVFGSFVVNLNGCPQKCNGRGACTAAQIDAKEVRPPCGPQGHVGWGSGLLLLLLLGLGLLIGDICL